MRLIDVDDFVDKSKMFNNEYSWRSAAYHVLCKVADELKNAPTVTVDATNVVHGVWKPSCKHKRFVYCSLCREAFVDPIYAYEKSWNYCPNCGAKMANE